MRYAHRVLFRNIEGKRHLQRSRSTWEDEDDYDDDMDLRKMKYNFVDWIHLTQDMNKWRALVKMVMNLRVL